MAGQSSQLTRKESKAMQERAECGKKGGMCKMHDSKEMGKKK